MPNALAHAIQDPPIFRGPEVSIRHNSELGIAARMPYAACPSNLRKTLSRQWRGIGTDPVPSRPRLRLDNGAISGLQAESGGACKRPLWLPLRSDICGFTVRSVGFSRFANNQGTEFMTDQSETP
jgi:hypothetical protein